MSSIGIIIYVSIWICRTITKKKKYIDCTETRRMNKYKKLQCITQNCNSVCIIANNNYSFINEKKETIKLQKKVQQRLS